MTGAESGDFDGDGAADVLVSDPNWRDGVHADAGAAFIDSGRDGTVLWSQVGGAADCFFGEVLEALGDLDGDGYSKVAISGDFQAVEVFSPKSGTLLRSHSAASGAPSYFGLPLAATGDVDQDGVRDYVIGAFGGAYVYSGATRPAIQTIQVDRSDYRKTADVTISGAGFMQGDQLQVEFGDDVASNVVVVDDSTITASICRGNPGSVDVTIQNTLGIGTLTNGFRRTPALLLEGAWTPGGNVTVRYLIDPDDGVLAIAGLPPTVDVSTRPFLSELCISPLLMLFPDQSGTIPGDEFDLASDLPNDPGLSGIEVLFQALIGPIFSGVGADATWSNCASITIR